jgi:hypothetical protein
MAMSNACHAIAIWTGFCRVSKVRPAHLLASDASVLISARRLREGINGITSSGAVD